MWVVHNVVHAKPELLEQQRLHHDQVFSPLHSQLSKESQSESERCERVWLCISCCCCRIVSNRRNHNHTCVCMSNICGWRLRRRCHMWWKTLNTSSTRLFSSSTLEATNTHTRATVLCSSSEHTASTHKRVETKERQDDNSLGWSHTLEDIIGSQGLAIQEAMEECLCRGTHHLWPGCVWVCVNNTACEQCVPGCLSFKEQRNTKLTAVIE